MSGVIPICKYPKIQSESPPPWIELPADVTANILQRLEVVEILESAESVCATWRRVCWDPSMWRALHIKRADFGNQRIRNLWRRVVDRSQGHLLHLSIQDFCDPNLLNYTLHRSSELKHLTIEGCHGIIGKTVVEAVTKLAHLEELHLIKSPEIEASDIVKIGNACPLLKSFTFTRYLGKNECAVAIANNMPNLSHLCLISNLITNEGLEAILDGCSKLDSLDLRHCPKLDLGGALGKRCSQQIKHLKFPFVQTAIRSSPFHLMNVVEMNDWFLVLDP